MLDLPLVKTDSAMPFAIGFLASVETVEPLESIEFFLSACSVALRIGEHNGALFIYYTVIALT